MSRKRDTYVSPLIEARMPDASLEEKRAAQAKLWAFFDALYSIFEDVERELCPTPADDNST